jgi:hypothetical protein
MSMKTLIKISAALLIVFSLWSCEAGSVVVTAQPEVPVYERPVAPYSNYIWIEGDWYWSGGRYVYHRGYWAPPRARYHYVPGGWEHRSEGYHWRRGGWHK